MLSTQFSVALVLLTLTNVPQRAGAEEPQLYLPNIGVRQEDLAPEYSQAFNFVWIHVPQITGCILDMLCYEHSNLEYVSHEKLDKGLKLRHRSLDDPKVLLITTITPEAGAVNVLAHAELDPERAGVATLPEKLPQPNLCFRVKRSAECFGSFPYPFSDFIGRCFIFTGKGRVFLTDTKRNKIPRVAEGDPRNNPPWVQVYHGAWKTVPPIAPPGTATWYNHSPDQFVAPVIGVVSRDGKHLVAIANDSADSMTQAWQECLHNLPKWSPQDAPPANRRWHLKIYIMANYPDALLARVRKDFPEAFKHATLR
jgi:hypothetical protein